MDFAPLLVLPLIGGYAFSSIWFVSLFHASRETGHRLYFRAAFYAFFLIIISTQLHVIFFSYTDWYPSVIQFLAKSIKANEARTLIYSNASVIVILCASLFWGVFLGHLLNFSKWPFLVNFELPFIAFRPFIWWQKYILKLAIKNNDFELLLYRGFDKNLPIMFTLNTGKVYVGWLVRAPNPVAKRKAVRILPLLSGYRSNETQRVAFTTDYYDVLEKVGDGEKEELNHLMIGDFEVVIPSSQICASHLFDVSAYLHFQEADQEDSDETALLESDSEGK